MNETSNPTLHTPQHLFVVKTWLAIGVLVFTLMMVVGVILRAAQGASMLEISPNLFYQLMTLHAPVWSVRLV